MLSQELIGELHQIIDEEYGLDLSLSEVKDIGQTLVSYFGVLLEIKSKNHANHKTT